MMYSYVNKLIEANSGCKVKCIRTILTDCEGIDFIWEVICNDKNEFLLEEEIELLLENKLLDIKEYRENQKDANFLDYKPFDYGIVAGILAPSMQKVLRKEVVDYIRNKGYISENMKPLNMQSGIKSLIQHEEGTYHIIFRLKEEISKKINRELLEQFTKVIFQDLKFEINNSEIKFLNLSEDEVFSKKSIELFRKYDKQLFFLNWIMDKEFLLVLRAMMQVSYVTEGSMLLSENHFEEPGMIKFPKNIQKCLMFKKKGMQPLNCGELYITKGKEHITYEYEFSSACNEQIRLLMRLYEKVLKVEYGAFVKIAFSSLKKFFGIKVYGDVIKTKIECEFICFDMAVTLLRNKENIFDEDAYNCIISLLELDASGLLRDKYYFYREKLQQTNFLN